MELNFKTTAMVRTLNGFDTVTIKEKVGDNQYLADYKGTLCIAMFNPFAGNFYVDDIYGALPPSVSKDQWETAVQEMKYLCECNQRELEAYRKLGSVASLKALKYKEAAKKRRSDKITQVLVNIFLGFCGALASCSLIYYIAIMIK